MLYEEMLQVAKEKEFWPSQLMMASEVDYRLHNWEETNEEDGESDWIELEYTQEEFEDMCSTAYECYLKDDANLAFWQIAKAVVTMFKSGELPTASRWDILLLAEHYNCY